MSIEDFTTWTETDTNNRLVVDATSVTIDDLNRSENSGWVSKDYGSGYWSEDYTYKFEWTTPASGDSTTGVWIYPLALTNSLQTQNAIETLSEDSQGILFINSSGNPQFGLFVVEGGNRTSASRANLNWSTKYYFTFARDDDGGANNTGQLTLDISTGDYVGGGSWIATVDSQSLDCAVGEQNDFQYIMCCSPRGSGDAATDGLLENFDSGISSDNLAGTATMSFTATGTLQDTVNIAGTASMTFSGSAFLTTGMLSAARAELSIRRVVAIGNDQFWYEDI